MSKSETLKRLVEALSCTDPLALHEALELNSRELTHSRKGSVDTDHFCTPSVTVKRKLSDKRAQKILDIERIMKIPFVAEFCTLSELGFIPYSMATKLGELQRQGACANHVAAFKVVDPKFSEIPAVFRLQKILSPFLGSTAILDAARWDAWYTEEMIGTVP